MGSITAGPARTVDLPLEFLDDECDAHVVRDNTQDSLRKEHRRLEQDGMLRVDVAANGEFALFAPSTAE